MGQQFGATQRVVSPVRVYIDVGLVTNLSRLGRLDVRLFWFSLFGWDEGAGTGLVTLVFNKV